MVNNSGPVEAYGQLQERVVEYWENILRCEECFDEQKKPLLKDTSKQSKRRNLRFSNLHRVPHIGDGFVNTRPRVVLVGLEDPTDKGGESPKDPLKDMRELSSNLMAGRGKLKSKHRRGESLLVRDILSLPSSVPDRKVLSYVATINSHLCSLVSGSRSSASELLLYPCAHSWKVALEILAPDIIVVEGKNVLWKEATQALREREWRSEKVPINGVRDNQARLLRVAADARTLYVLLLYHPSRWWSARSKKYYLPVVMPIVEVLRRSFGIP